MVTHARSFRSAALMLGALSALACGPSTDRGASSAAPSAVATSVDAASSATAAASASASASTPPAPPPQLRHVHAFPNELKGWGRAFDVRGELMLSDDYRVFHVGANDKLEPAGEVTKEFPISGPTRIFDLDGTYPDALDACFASINPRAPMPYCGIVNGKGSGEMFGAGGGMGYAEGFAYRDQSVVVFGADAMGGPRIVTVRGPTLKLELSGRTKVGCPGVKAQWGDYWEPAVYSYDFDSGKDGTIYSVGDLCEEGTHALEIWPREGPTRIVKIKGWAVKSSSQVLPGNDVWLRSNEPNDPILVLRGDTTEPLPKLARVLDAFVAPDGTLYASDGSAIHHWEGGAWKVAATLEWPLDFDDLLLHDGAFWGSIEGTLFKLEPHASQPVGEGCSAHFVHVFDIKRSVEPGYSFPSTRKALGTFDKKAGLKLVEVREGGRRLGVPVPDRATGEALVAHIKATMKDESPRLLCYEPKKIERSFSF